MFTTKGSSRNFNQDVKNLIKQGKNAKVKSSIKLMDPSKMIDSSKTSLLHLAAKYNNCDLTQYLIKKQCKVNAKNSSKTTPLMMAATSSSFKAAQILIEANADIYTKNSSNNSALQLLLNNKKIPQYLVDACLDVMNNDSITEKAVARKLFLADCPIKFVIRLKRPKLTRMLINQYNQIDPQQLQATIDLALKLRDQENVSVLLECGAEIDISKTEAVLFLDDLCPDYDEKTTKEDEASLSLTGTFLDKVSNWNSLREYGVRWFGIYFEQGSRRFLELFLQRKVNDYVKNKFPGQDLLINIFGNFNDDARELLTHLEFDVNSRGQEDFTALHFAVRRHSVTDVQTLLELGANPNNQDCYGRVPLAFAYSINPNARFELDLESDERKLVELLLLAGADPQLDMVDPHYSWYFMFSKTKIQMMVAQLVIDESLGRLIKETIRHEINTTARAKDVYEVCCQQLERFKTMKVYGSITVYTMLTTDVAKLVDSIRDREALEAISNSIEECHFYYVSKLKNSIKHISHTIDLREKVTAFICEATGWPDSQYIILERIVCYLTYKDLLVFD